jgi:hypothetical protein
MRKNKSGIHLPTFVSDSVQTLLENRDFEILNDSVFVADRALKVLIERSVDDFQGRRMKQLILENSDFHTRDWLQDVRLGWRRRFQSVPFLPASVDKPR